MKTPTNGQIATSIFLTTGLCFSLFFPLFFLQYRSFELLFSLPPLIWSIHYLTETQGFGTHQRNIPNHLLWFFITLILIGLSLYHYIYEWQQVHHFWQIVSIWNCGILISLYLFGKLKKRSNLHESRLAHRLEVVLRQQQELSLPNDIQTIYAGEVIPIDGQVLTGEALVNESLLIGNQMLQDKRKGMDIWAGSILELGQLQIKTKPNKPEADTPLENTSESQNYIPPSFLQQSLTTLRKLKKRAATQYAWTMHLGNLLIICVLIWAAIETYLQFLSLSSLIPPLPTHQIWTTSLTTFCKFLMVICPLVFLISIPYLYESTLDALFQKGVRLQDHTLFAKIAKLKYFVFSKTGVLTTGKFQLQNFHTDIPSNQFKAILLALEQHCTHPYAKAIVRHFKDDASPLQLEDIQTVNGLGVMGKDASGNTYMAGAYNIAAEFTDQDQHSIYVLKNNQFIGWIDLQDRLREEAEPAISQLKNQDLHPILLSGDRPIPVQYTARKTGIRNYHYQQLPQQKKTIIEQIEAQAPSALLIAQNEEKNLLRHATIGIELESLPDTQTSTSSNDTPPVRIFHHRLLLLNELIQNARSVVHKTHWSIALGGLYNISALTLVALGYFTLIQAAIIGFLACWILYLFLAH